MYAHIKGIAAPVLADRVVIEASGVGYELICSANTLRRIVEGSTVKLYTHFHVAQDAIALYGFYTEEERAMFRRLISVTRIGPRVALNVLSVLTPEDVALAVLTGNSAALAGVPGLGKKTAERIILELKDKVDSSEGTGFTPSAEGSGAGSSAAMRTEAIAALVALGYDGVSAGRAVASVEDCERVEDMITAALRSLAKAK